MTTEQINSQVQAIIDQYDRGELSGLDFALAMISHATTENPEIRQRVNEILRKEAANHELGR